MTRTSIYTALALALLVPATAAAQAPTDKRLVQPDEKRVLEVGRWYNTLEAGLNLTQASYSSNWKGNETGTISWASYLNGDFENQIRPSLDWLTTMRLAYGQTKRQVVEADGNKKWEKAEKSADRADVETIARLTKGWPVDPYASVRLETFFQDVTDPEGRNLWLNPMTIKEAVGVARKFVDREDHQLLSRIGFAARETHRRFFADATGDATTSNNAWDGGIEWVTDYKRDFSRLTWVSKLSVYQPLTWSKKSDLQDVSADSLAVFGIPSDVADYTTTADIDWQNTFSTAVSKYVSFNLYIELLYDKYDNTVVPTVGSDGQLTNGDVVRAAIRKKGQIKQVFGIGLTFRFM